MADLSANPFFQMMARSELTLEQAKKQQSEKMPEITPRDLSGKVVVVTGANTGIGYESSKSIASMKPAKLIMACRNLDKAREASAKIKSETGFAFIEEWELDLASFASTRAFAKRFLDTGLPLDTLVSNAGLSTPHGEWHETGDGYEITIQVNHLANMLLCVLLAPAIRKAKSGRIVVVASEVHFWSPLNPDVPNTLEAVLKKPEKTVPLVQYCNSKLLNVLFAKEFARRCSDIWICSCTPGYTESELGAKNPKTGGDKTERQKNPLFDPRSTYEGSKTIIHCAITPLSDLGDSGAFFSEMRSSRTRSSVQGETGRKWGESLWRESMEILKKSPDNKIEDWAQ